MPEISRFFGIIIAMFYDEHNPPHFHVRYNEHKAEIAIQTFAAGNLHRLAPVTTNTRRKSLSKLLCCWPGACLPV